MKDKIMTEKQRIEIIRHAVLTANSTLPTQSVADFIADVKSQEVFTEHGLLDNQKEDVEDESQFLFSDEAEKIDEEDKSLGLSDEMKGVYK
jgi:hypothetical protein